MLLAKMARLGTAILVGAPLWAASINVYLSPPGAQDTTISGVEKEDFDSMSAGLRGQDFLSGVGTYRLGGPAALQIVPGDQWGGAFGTNYSALGKQSQSSGNVQLDLFGPRAYFGFWWSAVDPLNVIQLYSGGSLLGQITRADINAFLPGNTTVTSLAGAQHDTTSYFGNPVNGQNPWEQYAYIHFVASGVTFDRIVFQNAGEQTGFETDNVAARETAPVAPDFWVPFREIQVPISNQTIPEPATAGLAAVATAALILRRGKKTAA